VVTWPALLRLIDYLKQKADAMLLNYILLTFRTLLKNKVTFFINLAGMSIALGCCIAAYVNYEFNAGFDKTQENSKNLYRVSFVHEAEGKQTLYGVTPMPLPSLVKENFDEVDDVVHYISKDGRFRIGDELFQKEFVYADPNFTKLFTLELLLGSLDLTDKTHVLISDKLAMTYFNTKEAVGKPLTQIVSGQPKEYVISGVYKAFPFNSSFRFDLLTTFDNYFIDAEQRTSVLGDWKKWTTTFLYVKNADALPRIEKQLEQFVIQQNEAREDLKVKNFFVEPLTGMAKRAVRAKMQGHWFNMPMPPAAVIAPFFMAGLILLVACFNFMNNAIAVAGKRLKEIGIRKVVGGKRRQLIVQFLSETFIFCFVAGLIALVLGEYFVAGWDALWPGIELSVRYADNIPFIVMLILLLATTAFLAGAYPAFYISSFRPIQILRGTTKFGGTNLLTKCLLVFQFTISLAAVIFSFAFYNNSKFQKAYDLGYDYHSVVQVPVDNQDQFNQLKNAISTNPLITSVGGSEHHIYAASAKAAVKTEKLQEKEVDVLNVGEDYFKTLNVRIISGRAFEKDKASDYRESIIVNEEFLRVFNLPNEPFTQRITINDTLQYNIVGVVKDVYLRALFEPLTPLVFRYTGEDRYRYLVASTDPSELVTVNNQIRSEWKKLFPNTLYTGRLMEEHMVMAMEHFDNAIILYTFLGIVAIVMSISGLYSLVSLNLQKRTKELGIRKVLGAPLLNIILQASKLFLIIMIISFALGSFAGSFLVNTLMNNIWEYYESIDIIVLSISILSLFTIASITVALKIFRVSSTNPVDSLRYE
jgi:putative ABC transport system permease protein